MNARTLVRFAFAALFVNALAVACVVSDDDDGDDDAACDPGSFKDCSCADGASGTKKCNASGSGYGVCACDGGNQGGDGSGGGGPSGGSSQGGATSGGEGGAGGDSGGLCAFDATDLCQSCAQVTCCAEWTACALDEQNDGEGDCADQFFNIMECTQQIRKTAAVVAADLQKCAEDEVAGGSVWSAGLRPGVKPLIDCVGGGEDWETRGPWNDTSCKMDCFAK